MPFLEELQSVVELEGKSRPGFGFAIAQFEKELANSVNLTAADEQVDIPGRTGRDTSVQLIAESDAPQRDAIESALVCRLEHLTELVSKEQVPRRDARRRLAKFSGNFVRHLPVRSRFQGSEQKRH